MDEPTRSPEIRSALLAARALLVRGWAQGSLALDAMGHRVAPYDPRAVCWCAEGALFAGASSLRLEHREFERVKLGAQRLLVDALHDMGYSGPLSVFNDRKVSSVETVLAVFDYTLALIP